MTVDNYVIGTQTNLEIFNGFFIIQFICQVCGEGVQDF